MSYSETLQQTMHSSINYNASAADLLATLPAFPIIIRALGAVVTTAFVTTTQLKLGLDITDADGATETTNVITCTIPTGAAVGDVIINRPSDPDGAEVAPPQVNPGGNYTITVATQGVGSAGACRPFVIWSYESRGDGSNIEDVAA